ncbi:MAG: hypothetical protein PHN82_01065 [bacterium]|nr:hypothetical protein [bacterium]
MSARLNRVMGIALAASVCFNAFFVIGYWRARTTIGELATDEGRVRLIARRLGLSEEQEERFLALRRRFEEERALYDAEHAAEADAFWEEMSRDDPDMELIREMLAYSAEMRRELRDRGTEYMREAFHLLSREQRQALARMIRERSYLRGL